MNNNLVKMQIILLNEDDLRLLKVKKGHLMIQKFTFSLILVSFKIFLYQNISMTMASMLSKPNIRPLLFYREIFTLYFQTL